MTPKRRAGGSEQPDARTPVTDGPLVVAGDAVTRREILVRSHTAPGWSSTVRWRSRRTSRQTCVISVALRVNRAARCGGCRRDPHSFATVHFIPRGCGPPLECTSNGPLPLPPKVERAVTRAVLCERACRAHPTIVRTACRGCRSVSLSARATRSSGRSNASVVSRLTAIALLERKLAHDGYHAGVHQLRCA